MGSSVLSWTTLKILCLHLIKVLMHKFVSVKNIYDMENKSGKHINVMRNDKTFS